MFNKNVALINSECLSDRPNLTLRTIADRNVHVCFVFCFVFFFLFSFGLITLQRSRDVILSFS